MIVAAFRFLSPAIALALVWTPLAAQVSGFGGASQRTVAIEDSLDLLNRARTAQRRFEARRRAEMPTTQGGGSGPCDAIVGRMCWRHGPLSLWSPMPEEDEVLRAREQLISELAEIGSQLPGDEWVLGQRVWYLLEAGRSPEASVLAGECGGAAKSWWCAALEGLALHVGGRYVEAEEAFGLALASMEPALRSEWEDVRAVLDGEARGVIEDEAKRSVERAGQVVQRVWRLADPLHLIDGNDRWTEHLARRTVVSLRSDAANPYGLSWSGDLAELLIRYGWEVGWERVARPLGLERSSNVVGHEHPDSRTYVVPGRVLTDPTEASSRDWEPSRRFRPSAYAPAYAPVILPMDAEPIVLTRGEWALIGAPFVLPEDTTYRGRQGLRDPHVPPGPLEGAPVQAGAFLNDARGETVRESRVDGRAEGIVVLDAPAGAYSISVEVLDPARGLAGRLRRGLRLDTVPPDVATLSPLLLLEAGPEPENAREALSRLDVDGVVATGVPLLVGWEIWGLGWREETLAYRLTVEEPGGGFFRRTGELLGLLGRERPVSLSWDEPGPERPGPWFRSVSMDLPDVEPGVYDVRLEVVAPGRTPLVVEREVRVGR
jgi:hypothetical protein